MRQLFALATLASTLALGVACGGKTDDGATTSDAGDKCTAGDKKKVDCNTCTCDSAGLWWCTTMACNVDAGCMPGSSKKLDDCNSCSCMANGEWACTGIACIDSGVDSGVDAARDPRCPASWALAQSGSHDDLCAESIACNYPEGSCTCPAYCGGPPPGPDWKPSWSCTPKRTDGCPEAELTEGSACSVSGKVCSYGSCCMTQYECVAGKWNKSGPICPP